MSDEPRNETPADEPPADVTTADTPAADAAPVKKAPAKKAPAKRTPVKKATPTGKVAPAEQAPAAPAPAEQPAPGQIPAAAASVEPTSAEPPPADATPATRAGSASAAAARRARRIGGRPAGGPRPEAESAPQPAGSAPQAAAAVSMRKPQVAGPAGLEDDDDAETDPRTVVVTAVPAWLNWAPAAVLGVGALIMAVLLIVFSHGVWWGPSPKQVPSDKSAAVIREQVLAAAKTCVATANTYQYTDLDTYERKALACTTGQFSSQLQDTIERLIKVNAPKLHSSQTAQINRGGIEAISPDAKQWTILLFGQLSVTNDQNKQPRTDPFAAQVRMDKVNGKWLIGALTTVSSPLS